MKILIVDGQGGGIGKLLIQAIRAALPEAEITAVGTNALATAAMLRAGAARGATGENAVRVQSRRVDAIVGPVGIVVADALLGEVTPAMALAIGQSPAMKILIPVNQCENYIVGVPDLQLPALVSQAVERLQSLSQ
ncbi:MAG TPA: DUF3842 family protein [Candidatus Pullichristensenella excrementigallinarum]|uniref:DUF3842 family protein n=1 Tax=Candidatus Pullichristensenella excrementigallinarum TaxID=2840907 RepID=A0A9D1LCC3_9FIRM|nr:DUF3842 family protein [Candidatus Pullichristensenella excrementigallinarum]